jgi:hypothetical protein
MFAISEMHIAEYDHALGNLSLSPLQELVDHGTSNVSSDHSWVVRTLYELGIRTCPKDASMQLHMSTSCNIPRQGPNLYSCISRLSSS